MSVKKSLRQTLLQQRRAFSPLQINGWSLELTGHLREHPWYQASEVVYAYRSFRQELSLNALWDTEKNDKKWAFPRCEGQKMDWYLWAGDTDFCISGYGIEEPETHWPVAPVPDLILVPTVACDRKGYRLGYGGGFYDRMLETLDRTRTKTIGIVPSQLLQDILPVDPWDQPLDKVCTELGFVD